MPHAIGYPQPLTVNGMYDVLVMFQLKEAGRVPTGRRSWERRSSAAGSRQASPGGAPIKVPGTMTRGGDGYRKCRGGAPRGVRPYVIGRGTPRLGVPVHGDPCAKVRRSAPAPLGASTSCFLNRAFLGARPKTHAGFTAEHPLRRKA